jgi:uncharacterized damage-inducible protein DinB
MTSVLIELYRHNTWATLQLIELLRGLPEDHLNAAMPGTYGSIRETLKHLVNSETGYYSHATQQRFAPPFGDEAGLDDLAQRIRTLGPLWERLMGDPDLPDRELRSPRGTTIASAPMAQAIHHADVHRTQILSILGAQGIDVPDLDMWEYGSAAGYVR